MTILSFLILFTVSFSHALEMSRKEFCDSQELSKNEISKVQFTIQGRTPHPALLRTIIRLTEDFNIPGPFVFHFTDYVGPKKVWSLKLSTAHHIYFSKNAPELLLGIELERIEKEVCHPNWTGQKTFEITYTNTVVEQFLRNSASRESLEKTLTKRTGWKLRGRPGDKYYEEEQDFRTEELVTIVKQLMDIPPEVFKKMNINKITRWRYGAPLPEKNASAIYIVAEKKIILSDAALMDKEDDVYGEGTILHEMGHAFWYGQSEEFRTKFTEISWIRSGDRWKKKKSTSDGFISEYAMTSPEEDFADHFSGFVHLPERLQNKAPNKNEFLQKYVFTDATYFTTVAENAKIKIDSPTPDTTPPWLEKEFISSYRLDIKERKDNSKIADIYFEVTGANDDLSGVAPGLITLTHTENKNYKVFIKTNADKKSDGTYTVSSSLESDPKSLAPGKYRLGNLALTDLAGNTKYYEPSGIPDVYLDGFMSLNGPKTDDVEISKIKLENIPAVEGYPGIKLTIPVRYEENFESVHLKWEFPSLEGKTVHVCKPSRLISKYPCLLTERFGDFIVIQSYFHKQYPNSKIKLASMSIHWKATEKTAKSSQDVIIPVDTPHLETFINTGKNSLDLIDLEVNQMKLRAITQVNKEGGDQNIEISLPILNHEAGEYDIMTTIRSPSGKSVLNIVSEDGSSKGELKEINGVKYLTFTVPLKKNPEDGIYMIESFRIITQYQRHLGLPIDQNRLSEKKIKLIERGIKRTFTIRDDKFTELN